MAKYTTYEVQGEKESFEDYISNISPTDCRLTAITGEKSISNKTHQWQQDELDAVTDNAQVEGWDAAATDKTPTTIFDNITQIFGKDGSVTDSNNAQDKYGRARELIYQKTKDVMALKRDIENAYVGTGQTRIVGDAITARKMDGLQAQIGLTANIAGVLTEAAINTGAQAVFAAGGEIDTLMVHPTFAGIVSGFTGKPTTVSSLEGRNNIDNQSTKVNGYVEGYVTQLGQALVVEYNRFIRATDGLLIDSGKVKRLTFRPTRTVDLAKVGSSTPYMCEYEGSLMNLNRDAHYWMSGITTS